MSLGSHPSSRRAILRSIIAAGAVAAVPATAAIASPDHPDAALLALQPELDAADRYFDEASDALTHAERAAWSAQPAQAGGRESGGCSL